MPMNPAPIRIGIGDVPYFGWSNMKTAAANPPWPRTVVIEVCRGLRPFIGSSSSLQRTDNTLLSWPGGRSSGEQRERIPPSPKTRIHRDPGSWRHVSRRRRSKSSAPRPARPPTLRPRVSDDGGVARVVLGISGFHLPHESAADVGRLRVDAAAELREEREKLAPKPKPTICNGDCW